MVVFVDLDEDVVSGADPHVDPSELAGSPQHHWSLRQTPCKPARDLKIDNKETVDNAAEERPNPNINSCTAALACYPIITQITHRIDLNSLSSLSRTCRQIRWGLLQYRRRLVHQTLQCENEARNASLASLKPSGQKWHILGEAGHLVSGKVSKCARDLVSDCRRCGRVVCRNCTLKPPSLTRLPSRHRRLCPACLLAPLSELTVQDSPSHAPCTCTDAIYLCAPCGASLATSDTTYRRIWTWRTRYSTYLGGLGTGIGEGNEGVKCARGKDCFGAKDVEVEFECSNSGSGSSESDSGDGKDASSPWEEKDEAGYLKQEIEGLGGIVKKKYRKRERVGGTVKEWEEERDGGEVLRREKEGWERSWCGWCGRVVRGERDAEDLRMD